MILLPLLLLIIIPIMSFIWAKRNKNNKLGIITCLSFGLIVSPLAWGIYSLGFFMAFIHPYIGIVPTTIALGIFYFHGAVGYKIAVYFGLQDPGVVVKGMGHILIEIINGIVWGAAYGTIGFIIDKVRQLRKGSKEAHNQAVL